MTNALIVMKNQKGFTLVELIAVIVLLGIIGTASVSFVQTGGQAYRDVLRRDEVSQIGRFAIERMSRELRSALPGSVRTSASNHCIEYVPVIASSIYVDLPLLSPSNTFDVVNFISSGQVPTRVAVYTLAATDIYKPISTNTHLANINAITSSATAGRTTVTLTSAHQFPEASPGDRVYFIDRPVSFCVNGTDLNRYDNYNFQAALPPIGANISLLAQFVSTPTPFLFTAGTLQSNGIVSFKFDLLARGTTDEFVRFSHEVALRGAP